MTRQLLRMMLMHSTSYLFTRTCSHAQLHNSPIHLIVTLLETLSIQLWWSLCIFSFIFASWWDGTKDIWGSVLNWSCKHNLCADKQFFYYVMSYVTIFSSPISHKRVSHLSLTSACLSMEIQLFCIMPKCTNDFNFQVTNGFDWQARYWNQARFLHAKMPLHAV